MIIYLHDIQYSVGDRLAANRSNIDILPSIENFLKKNSNVLLTADDGYKSIKDLLPMLEKYNVKLLAFISTGFLDHNDYPYEVEISNFLERNKILSYKGERFKFDTLIEKERFFKILHNTIKYKSLEERNYCVNNFFSENNTERREYREKVFMSWGELRELSNHPLVEIGSHGVSHLYLPTQDLLTTIFELKESKSRIEYELKKKVTKLSYPYGGANFKVKILARSLGYEEAYGTNYKVNNFMNKGRSALY